MRTKGGSRGGGNGAMAPPFIRVLSRRRTIYLWFFFHFFSLTPRPDISIFVQIWQWPCWTILQIPCWKSNRKTVPWINVWLNISCAEGLMLSASYDNDMLYYQRYFCPIGHRHRKFWVPNKYLFSRYMHHSRPSAFACRTARKKTNVPNHARLSQWHFDCSLVIVYVFCFLSFCSDIAACISPPCSSPSIGLGQAKIVTRQPLSLERRYLMFVQGIYFYWLAFARALSSWRLPSPLPPRYVFFIF